MSHSKESKRCLLFLVWISSTLPLLFFWYPAVAVDFMEISQSQSSMQSGDNGQPKSLLSLKKLSGPNNLQVNNHLRLESSTCFNTCQNLLTVNALFFARCAHEDFSEEGKGLNFALCNIASSTFVHYIWLSTAVGLCGQHLNNNGAHSSTAALAFEWLSHESSTLLFFLRYYLSEYQKYIEILVRCSLNVLCIP